MSHRSQAASATSGAVEGKPGRSSLGYAIGLLAAAILSLTGIFIAIASRRYAVPALVIAVWRDVFTALAIGLGLALTKPALLAPKRGDLGFLVVNGAVLAVFNILWTLSVVQNGAAAATLLVYSSGGFTVLLGRLFFGERIGLAKAGAVAASLIGAGLVSGVFSLGAAGQAGPGAAGTAAGTGLLGIVAGLASGLAYAVYSLVGKGGARRGLSPWTSVCYSFGIATLFLLAARELPAGLLPAEAIGRGQLLLPDRPLGAWIVLLLLAAGPTALGFGLYNASLARLPAGTANLVASAEPAFTALVAYLFLGERLGGEAVAGAAFIGLALLLLWLEARKAL